MYILLLENMLALSEHRSDEGRSISSRSPWIKKGIKRPKVVMKGEGINIVTSSQKKSSNYANNVRRVSVEYRVCFVLGMMIVTGREKKRVQTY